MKATQRQILKAAFIAVLAATALTPVFFPANSVYFAFIALVLAIIIFEGYSFWLEGRLAACMAAIPGDAPAEECEVAKFRDEFKEGPQPGPQPGTGPQPRTTSET